METKSDSLMERDAQELGELEALNNGKPVRIARWVILSIAYVFF